MHRRDFHRTAVGLLTAALGAGSVRADERDDQLARHKIAAIDFREVNLEWPRVVGRNAVLGVHGNGPRPKVCILKTDEGASGWGLIRGNRQSVEELNDRVIGKPVATLFSPAVGVLDNALLPLDFALHDLAGHILDLPVWKMVAGGARDEPFVAPIYSGMIYFDDLDPPEAPAGIEKLIEECQWDYDYGYRQFKLKIGRGHKWMKPAAAGMERDILAVRTIAGKFPDCDVLVDANNGYTLETCIEFLKGVAGVKLFWIEEPFHETLADYRRLHEWMQQNDRSETFLADGEARPDAAVLEQLQRERVLDIRLEDIVGHGFTPWRKLLAELAEQNVLASPHTWGTGVKTVYVAHLAGGLGNMPTIEGVTCSQEEVDFGENVIREGKQQVSSEPGFGLTLRIK
jgi:D-galactarolactone cycloisomerase